MRCSLTVSVFMAGFSSSAFAGAFVSSNDLVVATLNNAFTDVAPTVTLREYGTDVPTPTQVNAVTFDATGGNALRGDNSTALRDGVLNTSADGRYLLYTGYRQDSGAADPLASAPRVIGVVNASGITNASLAPTGVGSNAIRSAASTNGSDYWYTIDGTSGSLGYIKGDGTGQAAVSGSGYSYRSVFVTANDLYGSTGSSGTVKGTHDFGGLPMATVANPAAILPPPAGNVSISSIVAEDLSNATGAEGVDTIYAVGDTSLSKYSKVNGVWTLNGTAIATPGGVNLFGAAARLNANGTLDVYASTSSAVYRLLDGGYNSPLTLTDGSAANFNTPYLSAAAGEQFRGVAFAVPEPASLALFALAGVGTLRRRR